jgi:diguanylate cyclase (GGDEF)-like protein
MAAGRGNFRKLVEWLDGRSRSFLLFVSFLWLMAVGCVDYLTSPDIPLALFYLPPIGLAAWAAGSGWGAVASLSATGLWYLSELAYGRVFPPGYVAVWIASTRTGFFLVVSWLVSSLRSVLHAERENARRDPMTGIANSRHFRELVQEEIDRAGRYDGVMTLVYVDIDRFKEINDRLGHLAGDNLLRAVAEHLQRHLRSTDRVGRLGGDEFGILLPETGLAEAERLLSRLIPGLREKMESRGWPVTASVGIVACIDPPGSVDEILGMADEVMYSVKRRGRNGIACREFVKARLGRG